jgi:predicted unusual protein kinase regulating ubiquinone biosynthesis (AarF/ABC1/UbiB family)
VHADAPDNDGFGINLLDFGVVRIFEPRFVGGVIMLYEAVRDGNFDKAAEAYRIWGFKDLKRETMEVLNMWARFLYEPLLEDRVRPIQESDDLQYGRKVAEQVHAGLKRTGGVRIPREFPLMDRAAIGLGAVFLRLNAKLNWHQLFQEMIADFDVAKIAERQKAAIVEAGVPTTTTPG